jgi:methylamine dehydrogenase heavy chain
LNNSSSGCWIEADVAAITRCLLIATLLTSTPLSSIARAELPAEEIGRVEILPEPFSDTWFWASDPVLERVALVDFASNRVLGSVDGGWGITAPLFPQRNSQEFYVPETHYSRGSRGERTDVVTIYESRTLSPVGEVIIPPKRAHNALPNANASLTDDEQFLAVFNMTPAQSISIVDVRNRRFVAEIPTPGCSLTYAAGERRIMMFCADGALLFVSLNPDGTLRETLRTERLFDPQKDPLTEKGVRAGNTWYFVSFEGYLYSVDIGQAPGDAALFAPPWSLVDDEERADRWRIGGRQLLAIHEASDTAFVLMHQGDIDTHKTGGTHVWTFDISAQRKTGEHALVSPGFTFSGVPTEFGTEWVWPFNRLYDVMTGFSLQEPMARPDAIVVTQGEQPTLLLGGQVSGMVALYDAIGMTFSRRVTTGNYSNLALQLPGWGSIK